MVILVGTAIALGQQSNGPKPAGSASAKPDAAKQPPTPSTAEKALTAGLEEMLSNALHNNPDIRVAEAKLHEASAELNRIRLQVMQKVITFRHSVETQKAAVKAAEEHLRDIERLVTRAAVSQAELRDAQTALAKEKSKLATVEAEMPSLLGKLPQSLSEQKKTESPGKFATNTATAPVPNYVGNWIDFANQSNQVYTLYGQQQIQAFTPYVVGNDVIWQQPAVNATAIYNSVLRPTPGNSTVAASVADKLRQALDKPVTVQIEEKQLTEAIRLIEQVAPGVPFQVVWPTEAYGKQKVTLRFEQVPLGAVLQALEDVSDVRQFNGEPGLRLAVREYGILVTAKDRLPEGAILLHEFWKRSAGTDANKAAANSKGAAQSAATADVEGYIKAVDPHSGHVTISIGSNVGLLPGQKLEVYRLKPQAAYLGQLSLVDTQPSESVGKPVSTGRGQIQVGDRVARQLGNR
jgi:hypothetical protein